jgi:DNA polymerase-3 subunit delta'
MGLPPWLQRAMPALLAQRGHAVLLAGPPGMGQYELALALASAWLCEHPGPLGACGQCPSCHVIDVRTHSELFVLMPDQLALEHAWPLDPATQERIERKEIKPSRQIRVEAARAAVAFTQLTHGRQTGKVVLVYPAERLNAEAANTLLKTLEEPPGAVRFVLATEAAHQLLPTIRSRCHSFYLPWPPEDEGRAWLAEQAASDASLHGMSELDWAACWRAAGARPAEALAWARLGLRHALWQALPMQLADGDWRSMENWPPQRQLLVLMQWCHDLMAKAFTAPTRYFDADWLPPAPSMQRLRAFWRVLQQASRHVEHPFQPALWADAWAQRARALIHDRQGPHAGLHLAP